MYVQKSSYLDKRIRKNHQACSSMNYVKSDFNTVHWTHVYSHPQKKKEERSLENSSDFHARKLPEEPCAFSALPRKTTQDGKKRGKIASRALAVFQASKINREILLWYIYIYVYMDMYVCIYIYTYISIYLCIHSYNVWFCVCDVCGVCRFVFVLHRTNVLQSHINV